MWNILTVLLLFHFGSGVQVTTTTSSIEPDSSVPIQTSDHVVHQYPVKLNQLTGLSHGVQSGQVSIMDDSTFSIPNFYFDGRAPKAFFLVGKGGIDPANGTYVPLNENSNKPLPEFSGEDVILKLPSNLTIKNIEWLAVWCIAYKQNLGYVFVHWETSSYPPQTFGFSNIVNSGPIVLVNKRTLFIPGLQYDGSYKNVHFWVGNGSSPASDGLEVADENGSFDNLHVYQGENIYITLPEGSTTDNIDYFGVWSKEDNLDLGYVTINGIEGVPDEAKALKNNVMMRVPKCCPLYYVLTTRGCEERLSQTFIPTFNVYKHNTTHFDNDSLDLGIVRFEPYIYPLKCSDGKYPLDKNNEEFGLLQNGSLIVKGAGLTGIFNQRLFCMEAIEDAEEEINIFVCVTEKLDHTIAFCFYMAFTILSTICFIGAFFIYLICLKTKKLHRFCFAAYAFAMFICFLAMTAVQINVEGSGCNVLGFIFQLATIGSFTLLTILCVDIYLMVKSNDEQTKEQKRKRWYLWIGCSIPILSILISLIRNHTIPDTPNSFFKHQFNRNLCYFEDSDKISSIVLFYGPIIISIIVSIGFLTATKLQIVENDRELKNDYFWMEGGTSYKFMFRQCLLTLIIMTICSLMDLATSYIDEFSGPFIALLVIQALQGVWILAMFTAHHYSSTYLEKKSQTENRQGNSELKPLNQNTLNE